MRIDIYISNNYYDFTIIIQWIFFDSNFVLVTRGLFVITYITQNIKIIARSNHQAP